MKAEDGSVNHMTKHVRWEGRKKADLYTLTLLR